MDNQIPFFNEKKYWAEKITEEFKFSNFPFDFFNIKNSNKEIYSFEFPSAISQGILNFCNNSDVKLHIVVLSGIIFLLNKYTDSNDVAISTPIYKQNEADLINKILIIRKNILQKWTFKDLLLSVKDEVKLSTEYQDFPVEEQLHRANKSVVKKSFLDLILLVGGIHNRSYIEHVDSNFIISFKKKDNQLKCNIEYDSGKYRKSTIELICSHLNLLFEVILDDLDVVLSEIDLISSEQKKQLLCGLNNTKAEYPRDKTINQLFEKQVSRTPDNVSLILKSECITYRELNNKSDQLASYLRDKGVMPNQIVGLVMEHSIDAIVCILSILKAGGAYLPIDPSYPEHRINYMLNDSKVKILLTNGQAQSKFKTNIVIINTDDEIELAENKCNNQNSSSDLAYIIYTSGTTGTPKGTMIEHKNVVQLFFNDKFQFSFNEDDVWTLFHSLCFDFSVWEMYGALLYGGKLVITPKFVAKDPVELRLLLIYNKVTVLSQTPSSFYNLINEELKYDFNELKLRYVIFGGEALKPIKLKEWIKKYLETKLINMYGITETTVHVTYKNITNIDIDNNICNIGKPLPTLTTYILDKNQKLLPIGISGEICVGGDGVCRGYLYRDELTTEKFIRNPYKKGEIIYRSGDKGRIMPNGEIEYLGRIDQQVKIRGFRIELKEIENQLLNIEGINEAVVIDQTDDNDDKCLCAYFVKQDDDSGKVISKSIEQLRKLLLEKLPDYMIPSYFVEIEHIPLTQNGKLNHQALPKPKIEYTEEFEEPRNEIETKLVAIWSEVLGSNKESISINSNYFSIGGDSMKAIRLLSQINNSLESSLRIQDIYQYQTIKKLAKKICEKDEIKVDDNKLEEIRESIFLFKNEILKRNKDLKLDNVEDIYPMSDIEIGMVYSTLRNPKSAIYHDQFVYQLNYVNFDFNRFEKALSLIVKKHQILRTSFDTDVYKEPAQIVHKEIVPDLIKIDISQKDKKEQEQHIRDFIGEDRINPYKFILAPLWRMRVFIIDSDNIVVTWSFHHAILDGWSNASLMTELNNTYIELGSNKDYLPVNLKGTYKDYIIEQIQAKKDFQIQKYWTNKLSGYKRLEFLSSSEDLNAKSNLKQIFHDLGAKTYEEVERIGVKYNVSVKHICFAAYVYALNMFSYDNDFVVGLVCNNRPLIEDGDKILGCFLNTVPMRVKIPEDYSWRKYLEYIDDELIDIKNYDKLSLFEIKNIVDDESRNDNPFFDTIFNYVDFHIYNTAQKDKSNSDDSGNEKSYLQLEGYENTNTLFDFSISTTLDSFICNLAYSERFIKSDDTQRMIKYFINVLNKFIETPEELVGKDCVLSEEEKQKLLYRLNEINVDFPSDKTIHELFAEQVIKTPDKIAMVLDRDSMSYGELYGKAANIAFHLRENGVSQDDIVAIFMDRSIETIYSMLGVIKAGGAYLPIDPDYPSERINYILNDSGAKLLITREGLLNKVKFEGKSICIEQLLNSTSKLYNIENINNSSDLLYIIYTSGTTGTPKGVMVEHKNLVQLFFNNNFQFDFTEEDVWTMFHSPCFDFSVWEMYGALLFGGKLIVIPKILAKDIDSYSKLVSDEKVSILNLTPSAFNRFSETVLASSNISVENLRYIIFGGEALKPEKLKKWYDTYPNIKLINMFGITETTIHVTYKEIGKFEINNNISNIGTATGTLKTYVMDKNLNIVPDGAVGELLVEGFGVSRGYLGKKLLTKERFITNPYNGKETLYRSGDLVKMFPNGEMEYLGRIDAQIQLRGFRIELGEIESVMLGYAGIDECTVVSFDYNEEQYLCAYFVSNNELPIENIRNYLVTKLPDYMIPSHLIKIDSFSLNNNGKVDKLALPQPEISIGEDFVAPSSELEEMIVGIWAEILRIDKNKISLNKSFFELGGNSMKIMQLNSELNRELNLNLSVADLFQYPTITSIVKYLNQDVENVSFSDQREEVDAMENFINDLIEE